MIKFIEEADIKNKGALFDSIGKFLSSRKTKYRKLFVEKFKGL